MPAAALCPRRRRLYQAQLQSTWDYLWKLPRPGGLLSSTDQERVRRAFSDQQVKKLVDALEEILAPFVVYGVARDLERLRPSKVLFYRELDNLEADSKAQLLVDVLGRGTSSPSEPLKGYTIDKGLTLSNREAYNRYFDWIIDPVDVGGGDSGVTVFYQRYPLLLHAVKTATEHYQHNINLAVERMCANWTDICSAFLPSGATGVQLSSIQTTGNDFHKGGKQVLILTFAHSGGETKVVYKPSAVEIDCRVLGDTAVFKSVHPTGSLDKEPYSQESSLTEILNSLTTQSTDVGFPRRPLPTYRILPYNRGSVPEAYGYLEFLTRNPVIKVDAADDQMMAAAVGSALKKLGRSSVTGQDWVATDTGASRSFFHQMGKLMAMAVTFSLCDLHVQNLIVHNGQPHLIDVEEALKKPMTEVQETYLIGKPTSPATSLTDPDSPQLSVTGDRTSDMAIQRWMGLTRSPATSALYLWPADADSPEPALPVAPAVPRASGNKPGLSSQTWRAGLHRSALLLGFEEALDAFASPAGNAAAQSWLRSIASTPARYVTRATSTYANNCRDLYMSCCESNVDALIKSGRASDQWYATLLVRSDPGKRFLVDQASSQRKIWATNALDPLWRPPFFALEHPDHAWFDYFNGDVPAFYHLLGQRELLNSRGETVSVGSAIRFQDDYLPGVAAVPTTWAKDNDWPETVEPLYLPLSSVDIVRNQLQRLSQRWAKGAVEQAKVVAEAFRGTALDPTPRQRPRAAGVGGGQ